MSPTLPLFIKRFLIALSITLGSTIGPVLAQTVTYASAKHETLSQTQIVVNYTTANGATGFTLTGTAAQQNALWTVKIGGVTVPTTSVTVLGLNIIVNFDASALPGHTLLPAPFIMPGEAMTVAYGGGAGAGAVQVAPGGAAVPALAATASVNAWGNASVCNNDVGERAVNTLSTPDTCSPVATDWIGWTYEYSVRWRNSSKFVLGLNRATITWNDGLGSTATIAGFFSDEAGAVNAAYYRAAGVSGVGGPAFYLTFKMGAGVFSYPDNTNQCNFRNLVTIADAGGSFNCSGTAGLRYQTQFDSFDFDDQNTGALAYAPTVANTDRVCIGNNVNMTFTDNTDMNCNPATAADFSTSANTSGPANNGIRWIRFIYGSAGASPLGTIPDMRVAGTQVTNTVTGAFLAPYNANPLIGGAQGYVQTGAGGPGIPGVPDASGVIELSVPTSEPSGLISAALTTLDPSNQVVGQRFWVTLQYWNVCNKYSSAAAPVSALTQYVEIISKPAALSSNGFAMCYNAANPVQTFSVGTVSPIMTAIKFYNKNPLAGGATLMQSSASTSMTSTTYNVPANNGVGAPFKTSNIGGAYYSVWATQVTTGNNCESAPIEVVIIQQPDLGQLADIPATPTGLTSVCNGPPVNAVTYSESTAPVNKTIPITTFANTVAITLNTEDFWTIGAWPAGVALASTTGPSVNVNFNAAVQPPTFDQKNVSVALRYVPLQTFTVTSPIAAPFTVAPYSVTMQQCANGPTSLAVKLYGQTVGGSVTPNNTICNDGVTKTGLMTLAGHRGNVVKWQRTLGGVTTDIANTTTTLNEVPPNGPGVYTYNAVVQNDVGGPCSVVNSAVATITVNPVPSAPTISQGVGSTGLTICADGTQKTILQSDNTDGNAASYQWFKNAVAVGGATASTITLTLTTESGSYTVKKIGIAPSLCNSPLSPPVVVTINPLPTAGNPSGGGSVCSGIAASDIVWTLTGTAPFNLTYSQAPSAPVVTTSATNTFTIVAPNPAVTTTYQITALTDANGCVGTSLGGSTTVTVTPTLPPSMQSFNASAAVCDNGAGTTPPTATLDLSPDLVQTYDFTYNINGHVHSLTGVSSDAFGKILISPPYTDWGSVPGSYVITVTAIKNSVTLCAGAVPFSSTPLVVNPRPGVATGAVNANACSVPGTGVALNVADPDPASTLNNVIVWSKGGPALASFVALIPADGVVSGTHNKTFTPATSATFTYFAFVQNTVTTCLSATGLAVKQTQDNIPTAAAAGADQPNLCGTTTTMAATAADNGGTGKWTLVSGVGTIIAADQNKFNAPVSGLSQSAPGGPPVSATFRWTVTSALNACTPSTDDVIITTNALPTSLVITPQLCDDSPGAPLQVASVTLSVYNPSVTNAPTVQWYSSPTRTAPFLVTTPTVNNGDTFYFTATGAGPMSCVNIGSTTFTVNALPAATDRSAEYCEDAVGSGSSTGIDLTALEMGAGGVTSGGTILTRDVEWYEDNLGALGALIAPGALAGQEKNYTIGATKLVHAKVIDLTSGVVPKCFDIADVTLKFKKKPIDNPITGNATVCTGSSIQIYQIDPALNSYSNAGVSPTVHTYTWSVTGTATFTVVAGGGVATTNFFVLIKFPGPTTGNVHFTVFETVDGCNGNTKTFDVTVAGAPSALAFNAPETQVCKSSTKTYSLTATNPSSTYTWTVIGGAIIGPNVGLGLTTIGINWGTLTAPQPSISVTETSSSGCPGTPVSINIFLNDIPAMTSPTTYTLCSGFSPSTNPGPLLFSATIGSTFSWSVASVTGAVTSGGVPIAIGTTGTGNITQVLDNVSGSIGSVTYQVTPTESNPPSPPDCIGAPQTVVVTVNPKPVLVLGQSKTICSGASVGYEILVTPANQPAGTTFSWPDPDGGGPASSGNIAMGGAGTTHIFDILTNATNSPVTTIYTITATSAGGCVSTTAPVAITVEPQPVAAISNTTPLIANAANTNIVITSPTTSTIPANLKFDVAVSSTNAGATGGTSFAALANQSFPLTINGTLTNSSNSFITVTYTVTPKLTGCTNGGNQVTTVVVEPTPQGVITNSTPTIGNGDNVNIVISSPTGPTIPGNLTFDLGVSSTNGPATGGSAFANLTNQSFPQTINGVLTNSSDAFVTVTYTVTPKYLGSPSGPVQTTTVVVEPTPKAVIVNSTATVCQAGNVNIVIGSPTAPSIPANLKFDLTVSSTAPASTGGTAFANLANQTFPVTINGTLTNSSNTNLMVTYTVVPKLAGHANGPTQTTTVIVEPTPQAVVTNTTGTICNGDNVNITITSPSVPSIPGNSKFDLAISSNNAGATSGSAFTTLSNQTYPLTISGSLSNSSSTTVTVTFTITPKLSGCASGPIQTTTVLIEPTPQAAIANTTPLICNGGNINLNITSPTIPSVVANLHFDVAVSSTNAGATGGSAFTALANQTLPLPITGTLTNSSSSSIMVTFTITPKLAGCPDGPVQTTSVQVEPTPQAVIANGAASICNGGNVNLNISSSTAPTVPANLKFDVAVSSTNAGATAGTAFASLTNQSFPLAIVGTLTNSSNTSITVTYSVTPKLTGCANGTIQTASVVVEPTPQAAITNTTPTVCDGGNVNIQLTSPSSPSVPASLTFDLTVASNDAASTGGSAFSALNNQSFPLTLNGTLTNTSDSPVTVTFTLTPKLAGCSSGAIQTTQVIIEPSPDAIITNSLPTVCNNGNVNISITTTTTPSVPANLRFDVAVSSTNTPATGGTAFVALTNQNFPLTLSGSLTNSSNSFLTVTYTITPKLVGCTNGAIQTTTVIVEPTPQAALTNTIPTVCDGGNVNIQITSPSTPSVPGNLKFDVAVSSTNGPATGGSAFATLTGQTFPLTLNGVLTNSSNTNQTVTFTITPTLSGCASGPTKTTNVIVEPTPQAAIANTTAKVCNGGNVNLTITSPSVPTIPGNLKFDLAVASDNAGATGGGAFNTLSNQSFPLTISGTLTNSSNAKITVTYTVTPTLNGCANGPVATTTVIIEPTPQAVIVTTTPDVCNGGNVDVQISSPSVPSVPSNLGFDATASSTNAGATGGSAFTNLSNQNFPLTLNGSLTNSSANPITVTWTITPKLNGCASGPIQTTSVIVEPIPQATISNTTAKVCNGGNVNINITSSTNPTIPANLNFDVSVSSTNAGATAGTAFANLSNKTFPLLISGTLTNSSSANVTVTYTVTPKLSGCPSGPPQVTTVVVEPTPAAVLTNTTPDVCAGDNVSILITSPSAPSVPANLKFDVAVSSTNGAATGGSAFAALTNQSFPLTINGVLTNTSNGTLTVTFTITPKLSGCANGTPQTTNIIVEPFPQAVITNNAPTVCNSGNVNLVISTPSVPTTPANLKFDLDVSSNNPGATGGAAFTALTGQTFPLTISGILTNSSTTSVIVTYTVTPKLTGCTDGPVQTTTVTVEPTPQAVVTNSAPTVCNGGNVNLNITTLTTPSIPANQKFDVAVSSSNGAVTGGGAFTALANQSFPLVITGTLTNSSNAFVTVTFTITPKLSGCSNGPDQVVNVVVEPTPQASIANTAPTVCNGGNVNLNVTSLSSPSVAANLKFDVAVSSTNGGVTGGTAFTPLSNQSFPLAITGTLTNTSGSFVTVTFTMTPKLGGCANGPIQTTMVVVDPTPSVNVVNNKARVCNNDTPDIDVTSSTNPSVPANLLFDVAVTSTDPPNLSGTASNNQSNVAAPFSINAADGTLINSSTSNITVTYTITPKLSGCASGTPVVTTVTLEPTPVVTAVNNAPAICSTGSPNITISSPVTPSVATDQKFDIAVGSSNPGNTGGTAFIAQSDRAIPFTLNTGTLTNSGTTDLTVTFTFTPKLNGCPNGVPISVGVTVHPIPVVIPTAGEICSNNAPNVTFSAAEAGTVFNWQVTSITGSTVTGILLNDTGSGSTVPNIIRNVTSAQAQITFTVTPTGPVGLGSCLGAPKDIIVKVNPEPVLLSPGLDKSTCSDTNSGLAFATNGTSVAATSYIITAFNSNGLAENVSNVIKSATVLPVSVAANQLASEQFTNLTLGSVDVVYTVVPVGPAPSNCQGAPLVVKVTVNPEPFIVPGTVPVCSGDAVGAAITLGPGVGSVTPTQFELKKITNAANMPTGGSNAGLGTYNNGNFLVNDIYINNIDANSHDVIYEIVPITNGCRGEDAAGNGKMVTLTVNPAPDLLDNIGKTVCSGDVSGITFSTRLIPVASAPAANYNITNIVMAAGLVKDPTTDITFPRLGRPANEIAGDKFTNPTNGVLTVSYTVVPVTALTCKGVPEVVTLTVEPAVTMIVPANVNTCSDTPNSPNSWSIILDSNTTPSAGSITFDYTAASSPVGAVSGFLVGQSSLPRFTAIADKLTNTSNNVATVTYTITPRAVGAKGGAGCSAVAPTLVTVTVEPRPRLSVSPSTQVVCEGDPSSMTMTSTTVPGAGTIQFTQMSAVATGGMTLTSPLKTLYLNGDVIADIWDNPTLLAQTVTYTFRAQFNGGLNCQSDDITLVLTVNPRPSVTASAQAPICGDGTNFVQITLTPDIATANNTWTTSVNPAGAVSGAVNGAGNLIFQTIKNLTFAPATVTYTVTPKSTGCSGTPLVFSVQIDPIPNVIGVPATAVNVCYGGTLNIPLSSSVAGATFRWTVDPNDLSVPLTGSGSTITQLLNNTTGSQDFLTYTIYADGPGATACESQGKVMNVIAAPQMVGQILNPATWLCKGSKDFLQIQLDGQAPFTLVYTDGTTTFTLPNVGNFKSIQVQPLVTTTYTLVSMKDVFGCPLPLTSSVTYTVGDTDATFVTVGPTSSCSPYQVQLKYDQKAGTEYTWRWGDGVADSTYTASADVTGKIVVHTYTNSSPTSTLKPKIVLQTDLPAPFPGCFKTSTITLNIFPTIIPNVSADKSEICSGEQVGFTNQSFGATGHRWFYRVQGNVGQEIDVQTSKSVAYVLTNATTTNPIIYEVVYQASNANSCPVADFVTPITVYRGVTASFDQGPIPHLLVGGNSIVNFTNTSVPVDPAFRYDWDFSIDATPATFTGQAPGAVDYTSQGPRDVVLVATNIAAETAGLTCANTFTQTVNITLPPLKIDIEVIPPASCFPADIIVTRNLSTGDRFLWKLSDGSGLVSTSTDSLPTFHITNPGLYNLIFQTWDHFYPGTIATQGPMDFVVYATPIASFDVRPSIVFVPDTELSTFNFSQGANGNICTTCSFLWDFGDSGTSIEFEPKYTYKVEGKYDITLIVSEDHGDAICTDTLKHTVTAKQGGLTKVPNGFTPNPNGPNGGVSTNGSFNDVFLPIVKGVEEFNMQIFDRWGNMVFESNSASIGWDGYNKDGRLMPAGVYVYKLTIRLSDNQRSTQIGDVTMIR